ncbi:MAG: pilus assembly protein [Anaerolineae bacterium]|nr:pilus assembly protein [Anaerolineae bacterium]
MFRKREKGQSLIEVTFFLIILLILVAGIVEVGAILQTKLAVVNSAREGARFGTQSPSDEDITLVTQSAAANIINYQDDNAEIWVIHAKTGNDGTIGEGCPSVVERSSAETYWCVEHTLGDGDTTPPFVTKQDLQNTLQSIAGTEVVGVAVSYDHQSVIGLPYAVGGGGMPVTSFTVMRMETTGSTTGCQVWPIGVNYDTIKDLEKDDPLEDSIMGGDQGNFGWLSWNGVVNEGTVEKSMENPMVGSCVAVPEGEDICYTNGADSDDHDLSEGDWVQNATGWMGALQKIVDGQPHQPNMHGRYIRIVVWEAAQERSGSGTEEDPYVFSGDGSGQNCFYKVKGFAIIQITDLDGDGSALNTNDKTLESRFIKFDTTCD